MASKNVENSPRSTRELETNAIFPGVIKNAAEGLVYTDNARAITLNSRHKFREWTEEWAKAFSDGLITKPEYIDAGDTVVARFTVVGHKRRTIRFNEAHRTQDVLAVL